MGVNVLHLQAQHTACSSSTHCGRSCFGATTMPPGCGSADGNKLPVGFWKHKTQNRTGILKLWPMRRSPKVRLWQDCRAGSLKSFVRGPATVALSGSLLKMHILKKFKKCKFSGPALIQFRISRAPAQESVFSQVILPQASLRCTFIEGLWLGPKEL